MTSRTFGIEIEAHLPRGLTKGQLAVLIRRAGVTIKVTGYTHDTTPYWKIVDDGSVQDGGIEVVSPILSGEVGMADAHKVAEAMKAAGCTVSKQTGLHVHVGASDLNLTQMRALAINFVHSETAFDAIMPPSRRKDANQYIQSNRTGFGGSYENEGINKAIAAFNAATTMEQLISKVSSVSNNGATHLYWRAGNRYRKLNLLPYLHHKTVEFRQHAGTVDGEKTTNWIKLCVAMVDRSLTARPRPRTSTATHNELAELGMLLYWLRLDPATKKYFRARRKEFSARNLEATVAAERAAAEAVAATARAAAIERERAASVRRNAAAARAERRRREQDAANAEHARLAREAYAAATSPEAARLMNTLRAANGE